MPPSQPINNVVPPPQMVANDQSQITKDIDETTPKKKRPWLFISIIIILVLLIIGLSGLNFWTYLAMQDYKMNVDRKVAAAVKEATDKQKVTLEAEFAAREKDPLKHYTTMAEYGSVQLWYPKTWSAYITEQSSGTSPVDALFYPDYVTGVNSTVKVNYSLRAQVVSTSYKTELSIHNSRLSQGKVRAFPWKPELVSGAELGTRLEGQIFNDRNGVMVIVPLRDKVLKLWTENTDYIKDFDDIVLKKLTYSP